MSTVSVQCPRCEESGIWVEYTRERYVAADFTQDGEPGGWYLEGVSACDECGADPLTFDARDYEAVVDAAMEAS